MNEEDYAENLRSAREGFDDVDYSDGDAVISATLPSQPSIPVMVLLLAMAKDIIDAVLVLVVLVSGGLFFPITMIAGFFVATFFGVVIIAWAYGKSSMIRKWLLKRVVIKVILFSIIGLIPGINILPESTILVLLIYRSESKRVNEIRESMSDNS